MRTYDSTPTQHAAASLPSLTVSTTLIWGQQDRWQPVAYAHRLADDLPGARLVVEEADHFVMQDAPDRGADEIVAFRSRSPGAW